jgi:transcriptional regulator with PAS, ATPase and Fis domain
MFVLADSSTLTMDDLPETIYTEQPWNGGRVEVPDGFTLEDVERAVVYQTLDRYRDNRTHAAKSLGISVRTLQRRLKKWENATQ